MKVTIDGITYEGSEWEIRRIVENPPQPPASVAAWAGAGYPRIRDGAAERHTNVDSAKETK